MDEPNTLSVVDRSRAGAGQAPGEVSPAGLEAGRPWLAAYEPGVPAAIEVPELPLPAFLAASAARHPHRAAIRFMGSTLTYRQLDALANRFANALLALGIERGERVALLLPNCPQFVIACYGALRAGAVVVPTSPLYVEREIEQQLRDSGARAVVCLSTFFGKVQAVRARLPELRHVIVTNIKEHFPPATRLLFTLLKERQEGHRVELPREPGTHAFTDLLRRSLALPHPPGVRVDPDDLALLQYTGGTTGTPKAAMLTHRNLVANALQAQAWFMNVSEPGGADVTLGVIPLFHIYALTSVMNCAIVGGGTMILQPRFVLKDVLRALDRQRPHRLPGVPTMYMAINNAPDVARYDLRSLKVCVSGAAALPEEVQRRFESLTGAKLVEGYGLTEASPITHCSPILGRRPVGSIGVPLPSTDAAIFDAETGTRRLGPGEVGELAVRGPQVMRGYWQRPEETARVLRDGWLFTGDLARMDADGYFFIVDRKKDMIITGGMNVYPRDVEEPLYRHPKVLEAVAVGVPDERWGEAVKAFIVLKPGEHATELEIIDYCRANMAAYKVPKAVEFRSELPKSLVGKFLRRQLLDEELARRGSGQPRA